MFYCTCAASGNTDSFINKLSQNEIRLAGSQRKTVIGKQISSGKVFLLLHGSEIWEKKTRME